MSEHPRENPTGPGPEPPPPDTVERWAWDYVLATELSHKLAPPPVPSGWESEPRVRRLAGPGRPPELQVLKTGVRANRGALKSPRTRARLLSTFLHHELQAAELFSWAILAFAEAPRAFREGLLSIQQEEVRHIDLYRRHLEKLGFAIGDFPVRDWFWERFGGCQNPIQFVAAMGMGLEGANLEHAADFAARFRAVGDESGARIQEVIRREEIEHVRFGVRWFEEWTGGQDFEVWSAHLPPPLSPMLMRGKTVDRDARKRAGQSDAFLDGLCAWSPSGS